MRTEWRWAVAVGAAILLAMVVAWMLGLRQRSDWAAAARADQWAEARNAGGLRGFGRAFATPPLLLWAPLVALVVAIVVGASRLPGRPIMLAVLVVAVPAALRLGFADASSSARDVRAEAPLEPFGLHVPGNIETFTPGGGFVFVPAHDMLPDVPPQNIVAMFEAVDEYR